MKLVLLGAPGAGKGTQAEILSRSLGIPTISTGNILRAAVKNGTEVGLRAKSYMDAGKLVPDEVILDVVQERLAQSDCAKGYILDGVPRTIAQAEALEQRGVEFDHVVSLEITDEEIVRRMSGRRVCTRCGAPYHPPRLPESATPAAGSWSSVKTIRRRLCSTVWRSITRRLNPSRSFTPSAASWTPSPATWGPSRRPPKPS